MNIYSLRVAIYFQNELVHSNSFHGLVYSTLKAIIPQKGQQSNHKVFDKGLKEKTRSLSYKYITLSIQTLHQVIETNFNKQEIFSPSSNMKII